MQQNPGFRSKQALEYWRDWCDYLERPLIDQGMYQSGPFLHYIEKRWGEAVIAGVWKEAVVDDKGRCSNGDPFQILRILTQEASLMADYALHAYFFPDPSSDCYAKVAAKRYLSRALTKSVVIGLGAPETIISGAVQETGIRYYAVRLIGRNSVKVAFRLKESSTKSKCTAKLVAAGPMFRRIGTAIDLSSSPCPVEVLPGTDHLVIAVRL